MNRLLTTTLGVNVTKPPRPAVLTPLKIRHCSVKQRSIQQTYLNDTDSTYALTKYKSAINIFTL